MYTLCYFLCMCINCVISLIFLIVLFYQFFKKNCQKPKIARKFLALATVDAIDVSGLYL